MLQGSAAEYTRRKCPVSSTWRTRISLNIIGNRSTMRIGFTGLSRIRRPCRTRRNGIKRGQKLADHVDQQSGSLQCPPLLTRNLSHPKFHRIVWQLNNVTWNLLFLLIFQIPYRRDSLCNATIPANSDSPLIVHLACNSPQACTIDFYEQEVSWHFLLPNYVPTSP